jgi:hypothetical protein
MALNRYLLKQIRRTVIAVATGEILGRKLTRTEIVQFLTQRPVVISDGCGQRMFDCHRRRDRLVIRWGYSPEAAQNGCLEEAKRWFDRMETALRELARRLHRTGLPVDLLVVPVDERGMATALPIHRSWLDAKNGSST